MRRGCLACVFGVWRAVLDVVGGVFGSAQRWLGSGGRQERPRIVVNRVGFFNGDGDLEATVGAQGDTGPEPYRGIVDRASEKMISVDQLRGTGVVSARGFSEDIR